MDTDQRHEMTGFIYDTMPPCYSRSCSCGWSRSSGSLSTVRAAERGHMAVAQIERERRNRNTQSGAVAAESPAP